MDFDEDPFEDVIEIFGPPSEDPPAKPMRQQLFQGEAFSESNSSGIPWFVQSLEELQRVLQGDRADMKQAFKEWMGLIAQMHEDQMNHQERLISRLGPPSPVKQLDEALFQMAEGQSMSPLPSVTEVPTAEAMLDIERSACQVYPEAEGQSVSPLPSLIEFPTAESMLDISESACQVYPEDHLDDKEGTCEKEKPKGIKSVSLCTVEDEVVLTPVLPGTCSEGSASVSRAFEQNKLNEEECLIPSGDSSLRTGGFGYDRRDGNVASQAAQIAEMVKKQKKTVPDSMNMYKSTSRNTEELPSPQKNSEAVRPQSLRKMLTQTSVVDQILARTATQEGSAWNEQKINKRCKTAKSMVNMNQDLVVFGAQTWMRQAVTSKAFSVVSGAAVLANSCLVGYNSDESISQAIESYRGSSRPKDPHKFFDPVEFLFCLFFISECLLRVFASPRFFIYGIDWRWNLFDLTLVIGCIIDLVLVGYGSIAFISILRVFRMARILRIIRVMRFFRSLRIMVHSILNSMAELLWVFVLLSSCIYVTAICLAYIIAAHFEEIDRIEKGSVEKETTSLEKDFGNLPRIGLSLFSAISGGRDWNELAWPLYAVSPIPALVFGVYIFFVVFGVLNVVTGAFVDSIRLVSQRDNELMIEEELKKVNTFKTEITEIFESADADQSGTLSWDEFETHLNDERVRAYFASLELDISEAEALFRLLDLEETDEIPIDRFVQGCLRMRGDAKSIDVNMILYENEKMLLKLTQFTDYAEDQFDRLTQAVNKSKLQMNTLMTVLSRNLSKPTEQPHVESDRSERAIQFETRSRNASKERNASKDRPMLPSLSDPGSTKDPIDRRRSSGSWYMDRMKVLTAAAGDQNPPQPPMFRRGKTHGGGRLEAALNVITVCEH